MSKQLGKWITNDTVTGVNIRLNSQQYLRSRNAANSADINLLRSNSVDKAEFGVEPVYSGTPSGPTALVNQQYLLDVIAGIRDPKDAVRAAINTLPAFTPAGSGVGKTLTADANGALTVDGVSVIVGDRVGYTAASADAGIYVVTQVGDGSNPFILTRAEDADEDAEVTQGLSFDVVEGTLNGRKRFLLTTTSITVDTTSLTFVETPTAQQQVQFKEEVFTLDSTDISNGYVDLAQDAEAQSLTVYPVGGPVQEPTVDYTLSVPTTVTRVTFAGDLASTLADGDKLVVRYAHF